MIYDELKSEIREQLNQVAESFVDIGYRLKQIRDKELYLVDGYKDIYEFGQEEYKLGKSNVSRFMAINDKFSVNGNSPKLIERYEGYGSSKLSEMLTLEDEELKLVSHGTTRAEIREIKQVRKDAEKGSVAPAQQGSQSVDYTELGEGLESDNFFTSSDGRSITIAFFEEREKDLLNDVIKAITSENYDEDRTREIINPSGHLMFRKGLNIVMFEEDHIKLRTFGKSTKEYSYSAFYQGVATTYDVNADDPWVNFYGEVIVGPEIVESEVIVEEAIENEEQKTADETDMAAVKEVDDEKKDKIDVLPGQKEIDEYPELKPEDNEVDEKDKGTGKDDKWQQSREEKTIDIDTKEVLKVEDEEILEESSEIVETAKTEVAEIEKTIEEKLAIGYARAGHEIALTVSRVTNDKVEVIKALHGEEARKIYKILTNQEDHEIDN